MAIPILGLDIGGANLKAAHTAGVARTVPFALWKNLAGLTTALRHLCESMPSHNLVALTMTGEICDCFATRREGVLSILQSAADAVGSTPLRVWSIDGRFLGADQARHQALSVAASNWLALAHWVARRYADERVLLIDTGSTTTDIVYLNRGVPEPCCLVDAERLESGELVYTGLRRTPICAVLGLAVAAEFFATMLDAYVFAGLLPENGDDRDSADGRPMTRVCAHARLARMYCADAETFPESQALRLASDAIGIQRAAVVQACLKVMRNKPPVDRVVVSGSGEILGQGVAVQLGRPATSLADALGPHRSEAACAYAIACLAEQELAHG